MQRPSSIALPAIIAILAAALLLACQKKSPEEDLLHKVEPVGSWLASLQMAGEKWNANSVPTSFVKTTLSAAGKEFEKAAEEAAKSKARPAVRDPLRQLVTEAQAASADLRHAVEAGDHAGAARQAGRLAALHQRFEALRGPS
jgi:hypothetical protein